MPEERHRRFWHELAASAGHAVVNHYLGNENASPDAETMPEERQRRFWGALAGHVVNHFLGDESASPDAEKTAAEDLHNTYAAMPEDRQRRFWHQLAASAAHSVVDHYLG